MTTITEGTLPTAIGNFKWELEVIQDDSLQAFFHNALAEAPQSFHDDSELQEHVKVAFHVLRGLLDQRNVSGAVRDALLGTVLLCDIMVNEFDEDMVAMHTVAVRKYLEKRGVHKDINQALWENILRAIESHEGDKGASPLLEAKPGTAEYEVFTAFSIARIGYMMLDKEVLAHDLKLEGYIKEVKNNEDNNEKTN
jgi:hypothetical protein